MVEEELNTQQVDAPDLLSDQSGFSATQAILQAPPVTTQELSAPQRKKKMIIIVSLIVMVILVVVATLVPKKRIAPEDVSSSPKPTTTTQMTQMKQVIDLVTTEVNEANLDKVLLSPPQVDMEVEF